MIQQRAELPRSVRNFQSKLSRPVTKTWNVYITGSSEENTHIQDFAIGTEAKEKFYIDYDKSNPGADSVGLNDRTTAMEEHVPISLKPEEALNMILRNAIENFHKFVVANGKSYIEPTIVSLIGGLHMPPSEPDMDIGSADEVMAKYLLDHRKQLLKSDDILRDLIKKAWEVAEDDELYLADPDEPPGEDNYYGDLYEEEYSTRFEYILDHTLNALANFVDMTPIMEKIFNENYEPFYSPTHAKFIGKYIPQFDSLRKKFDLQHIKKLVETICM